MAAALIPLKGGKSQKDFLTEIVKFFQKVDKSFLKILQKIENVLKIFQKVQNFSKSSKFFKKFKFFQKVQTFSKSSKINMFLEV